MAPNRPDTTADTVIAKCVRNSYCIDTTFPWNAVSCPLFTVVWIRLHYRTYTYMYSYSAERYMRSSDAFTEPKSRVLYSHVDYLTSKPLRSSASGHNIDFISPMNGNQHMSPSSNSCVNTVEVTGVSSLVMLHISKISFPFPFPSGWTTSSAEAVHQLRPNAQPRHNQRLSKSISSSYELERMHNLHRIRS